MLEDALEGLEDIDDLASLELSPALTGQLAAYQDVIALCREAFPVEEPSDALLVDVLAEAQAVSRRPKLREADGSAWRRFWDRWRGTLLPGFALAGTAVAVLWVLEPSRELPASTDLLADNDSKDKPNPTPSEPASEPSVEPQPKPGSLSATDPVDDPASEDLGSKADSDASASKRSKPRPRKQNQPAVSPDQQSEAAPEPMTKDETWTSLGRANADRRKGDCDHARSRYEQVIAASNDTLAVARAKAGIGLCLEQDRRTSEANAWFDEARVGHAGIDAWINDQRDEQPLPGQVKRLRRKKARALTSDSLDSL